jgi:hypothetical protein
VRFRRPSTKQVDRNCPFASTRWPSAPRSIVTLARDIKRPSHRASKPDVIGQSRARRPLDLKAGGFGEVDGKPIALALVAASHLGAGVTEVPLHMRFLDLGG